MPKSKPYINFWGKIDKITGNWHPLVCHMLDVAAVARKYAEVNKAFIKEWCFRLSLTEVELLDLISFFALTIQSSFKRTGIVHHKSEAGKFFNNKNKLLRKFK